jgi:hypothetical protein
MVDEIIKKNKETLKEIDQLDKQYCQNIKSIAKLQAENVLIKSKTCKLRTNIKTVRAFRERRLTQEEKDKIIAEVGKCEWDEKGETCNEERRDFLTVHHKKKLSEGGTNKRSNLQVLCIKHHGMKHPFNDTAVKKGEIILPKKNNENKISGKENGSS